MLQNLLCGVPSVEKEQPLDATATSTFSAGWIYWVNKIEIWSLFFIWNVWERTTTNVLLWLNQNHSTTTYNLLGMLLDNHHYWSTSWYQIWSISYDGALRPACSAHTCPAPTTTPTTLCNSVPITTTSMEYPNGWITVSSVRFQVDTLLSHWSIIWNFKT